MSEYQKEANIVVSAMKADVHPQTARKYIQAAQPPEQLQQKHGWRTRPDPLAAIWEPALQMLFQAPELEAKELFEYLRGIHPDQVAARRCARFNGGCCNGGCSMAGTRRCFSSRNINPEG